MSRRTGFANGEEDPDLMPWEEVARLVGVSRSTARRVGLGALKKMRAALEAAGFDAREFLSYLRVTDAEPPSMRDQLAHILPQDRAE